MKSKSNILNLKKTIKVYEPDRDQTFHVRIVRRHRSFCYLLDRCSSHWWNVGFWRKHHERAWDLRFFRKIPIFDRLRWSGNMFDHLRGHDGTWNKITAASYRLLYFSSCRVFTGRRRRLHNELFHARILYDLILYIDRGQLDRLCYIRYITKKSFVKPNFYKRCCH